MSVNKITFDAEEYLNNNGRPEGDDTANGMIKLQNHGLDLCSNIKIPNGRNANNEISTYSSQTLQTCTVKDENRIYEDKLSSAAKPNVLNKNDSSIKIGVTTYEPKQVIFY